MINAMKKQFFLLLLCPTLLFGGAGTATYDFLRLPDGARYASLGTCTMSMIGDPFALFSNPAGLERVEGRKAGLTYTHYLVGIHGGCFAYVLPAWDGVLGAGVSYLNLGSIEKLDEYGLPIGSGEFSPQCLVPTLGYARTLRGIEIGISLKAIYNQIDEFTSIGAATDFSFLFWPRAYPGLALGGSVHNLGMQIKKFDEEQESLPLFARLGGAYLLLNGLLQVAAEFSLPEQDFIFGLEWFPSPMFTLRGGYYSWGSDLRTGGSLDILAGLCFGAGFTRRSLSVDYAVTPMADLGYVHRVSLIYAFPSGPRSASKETFKKLEEAETSCKTVEQKFKEVEQEVLKLQKEFTAKQKRLEELQAELEELQSE